VYNVWLGGKDGFAADREAADQVAQGTWVVKAQDPTAFLRRAIAYLAGKGISRTSTSAQAFRPPATSTR
jgi:hypothetical protein